MKLGGLERLLPSRSKPTAVTWLLLAAFTSSWNAVEFGGLKLVDLFLVAAFVSVVIHLLANQAVKVARLPRWALIGAGAIAGIGVIHGALGSGGPREFDRAARWLVAALLLPWVAVMIDRRHDIVEPLAKYWAAGIAVAALVATFDKFGLTAVNRGLPGRFLGDSTGRFAGLTVHPNHLGLTCALALPFMLYFYQRQRVWIVLLLIATAGEVISGSRASQAVFVVVGLATILGPMKTKRIVRGTSRAAIAITVWFVASPSSRSEFGPLIRVISGSGTRASNADRAELATAAIAKFLKNPIFGHSMSEYAVGHSIPLQLLATGGAILLVAFTVYVVGAIRASHRLAKQPGADFMKIVTISLMGWFIAGPITNIIADRYMYVSIAIVAVAADRACRLHSDPAQRLILDPPMGVG